MMKFFKRRRPAPTIEIDDPLAIRDLLEYPSLRALLVDTVTDVASNAGTESAPVAAPAPIWNDLAAAGPIRFDPIVSADIAA